MAADSMAEDGKVEEATAISAATVLVTGVGTGTAEMPSITVIEDMEVIPAITVIEDMAVIPAIMAMGGITVTTTDTTMACGSRLVPASWD